MGLQQRLVEQLDQIRRDALYKEERIIASPQDSSIRLASGQVVLNFCANNYLGLANHPDIIAAAKQALDDHGFGLASVRFICGTQDLHRALESKIAAFFGTEDAILYSSCFDANGGLFETLLDEQDAVISDALNHASIIDGIRLCKAQRLRYRHADMGDLRAQLVAAKSARTRLIATDGVFSMDGDVAPLDRIVQLAREHDAAVMVDDSHATGFIGPTGRGAAEHHGVQGEIDIFTSTLGKALGGGTGGFTTAKQPVIDLLRQRSRPYLFSNSVTPSVAAAGIKVFELLSRSAAPRQHLLANAKYFREQIAAAGFTIKPGLHPIVPVMLFDAALAQKMAAALLTRGIYVIGFSYPVVPKGEARIRVQISAAHERTHLDRALAAFREVGKELGVIR
jgi:glycine C-acetyltransferase